MKVYEILREMAWVDKFNDIETKIRTAKFTVVDLIGYLEQEHNILVNIEIDVNLDPLEAGDANITSIPIHKSQVTGQPEATQLRMIGKNLMTLHLGGGVEPDTEAAAVKHLLSTLRHEMSHVRQQTSTTLNPEKNYIVPDINGSPVSPQTARYRLQAHERAQQALDIGYSLAQGGYTPDQFETSVKVLSNKMLKLGEGELSEKKTFMMIADEIHSGSTNREMGILVGQMALTRALAIKTNTGKKFNSLFHALIKQIKKQFPKIKGYYNSHKDHNNELAEKNAEYVAKSRIRIREIIKMVQQLEQEG